MLNINVRNTCVKLPKVLCSSVIRFSQKGESHGKIYLVDLETDKFQEVFDWRDDSISWKERGYDRGLRGIAFNNGKVFVASHNKILVFDISFRLIETIKGKYLDSCHEIYIKDNLLYITSTGFNSVLEYDLNKKSFIKGYNLKSSNFLRLLLAIEKKLKTFVSNRYLKNLISLTFDILTLKPKNSKLKLEIFDPTTENGPKLLDVYHINNVWLKNEKIFVSGTDFMFCYYIENGRLVCFSKGNLGNHNLRPYKNCVLLCDTNSNLITYKDRFGKILESFEIIKYNDHDLINVHLPVGYARQRFTRGLCLYHDKLIIGGSSPATISIYQFGNKKAIKTIKLSRDVRNAIHGLEIWPY